MIRVLFLMSAALWFVACGVTGQGANATRTSPPSNTPLSEDGGRAMPTLVAITEDVSKQSMDCGNLTVSGQPLRASDAVSAQAAAACFMSAVNVCQPAVLTIRESATGAIRQFSVAGARPNCLVRQALQPDANSAPAVVDCASADIQNEKLEIKGCSHLGDFSMELGN